jgi:hypothetical protein
MQQADMMQQQMPQEEMQPGMEAGAEQATPEEQAQLEQAAALADEMLVAPGESGDKVAQLIQQSQDIAEGIGKATATVVIAVEKRMGGLDDAVKLELAKHVVDTLINLAIDHGALAADEVNDSFEDAVGSRAYSEYITMKEAMGELDPQHLQASVEEAKQVAGVQGQGGAQAPVQKQGRGLMGI